MPRAWKTQCKALFDSREEAKKKDEKRRAAKKREDISEKKKKLKEIEDKTGLGLMGDEGNWTKQKVCMRRKSRGNRRANNYMEKKDCVITYAYLHLLTHN